MFVDAKRRLIVDELEQRFRAAARERLPQLVWLDAPVGWGKTRLVQELYRGLASEQGYWPSSLLLEDFGRRSLHRVQPGEFDVPAGAEMPWMWWGITCEVRQTGTMSQVLGDDITQLERHAEALVARSKQADAMRQALLSLGSFGGSFIVPSIGDLQSGAQAIRDAWNAARTHRHRPSDSAPRRIHAEDDERPELVQRIRDLLELLGKNGIPVVMVLDEAHLAEASVLQLLSAIFHEPMAIGLLCVAATRGERPKTKVAEGAPSFNAWIDNAAERRPERIKRLELERLSDDALAQIVTSRWPRTQPTVTAALAERADGIPLALEGLLMDRMVRNNTSDEAIQIEPEHVAGLSNNYHDQLADLWKDIVEDVRDTLSLAAVQGRSFVRDLVLESHHLVLTGARDDAPKRLEEATRIGWIRTEGTDLTFHEFHGFEFALMELRRENVISRQEFVRLCTGLTGRITEWKSDERAWQTLPSTRQLLLLDIHVTLARQLELGELAGLDVVSAIASAITLGRARAERGGSESALASDEDALELAGALHPDDPVAITTTENLAETLDELGRYERALEVRQAVLAARERVSGGPDPLTVDARAHLAATLARLGRDREALEQWQLVVQMRETLLGSDSESTREAQAALALCLSMIGRHDEAVALQLRVLADSDRLVGHQALDTLQARNALARILANRGDYKQALDLQQGVLADQERRLRPDHPDTVLTRHNLALTLGKLGRYNEALKIQRRVLAGHDRGLAPDHPKTLSARENLAVTLGDCGNQEGALALHKSVLAARERNLGPHHRDTLRARHSLASTLGKLGDYEHALELQRSVLAAHERILGPDHPDTLAAGHELASTLGNLGNYEHALELQRSVLANRERILGPGHPDTLAARNILAYLLLKSSEAFELPEWETTLHTSERILGHDHPQTIQARELLAGALSNRFGRHEDALPQWQRVFADRERILGTDHSETLRTRSNLANALGNLDRYEKALTHREHVLEDTNRIHGADHSDTIQAREDLDNTLTKFEAVAASLSNHFGRHKDALPHWERVVAERERIQGTDHPDTLLSRQGLGASLYGAGEFSRAVEDLSTTVAGQARVLGPDHPHTLNSRHWLGTSLQRAGDFLRAIDELGATVEGRTRVLGADHPDTLLSRQWLGASLHGAGELTRAVEDLSTTVAGQARVLGPDHRETLLSRHCVASSFQKLGEFARAVEAFDATADDQARVLGADHPDTLASRRGLVTSLAQAGEVRRAITELAGTVERQMQTLGADHPETLRSRHSLGDALRDAGDLPQAIDELRAAVDGQTQVLGVDHPETLGSKRCLDKALTLNRAS